MMTLKKYTTGLLKRYCKRPPKLENLTLADWAAWLDDCSSKPYVKQTHEIDIDWLSLQKYIDDEQNDNNDGQQTAKQGDILKLGFSEVCGLINKKNQKKRDYCELLMLFAPWRNEETRNLLII